MERYAVLEKTVGETPLSCAERWRSAAGVAASVPLAYAGRLDPMASGKLLILIGDECKNQTNYHGLDKAYDFSVLLGIGSDTHDVLGRLYTDTNSPSLQDEPTSSGALRGASPSLTPDEVDWSLETNANPDSNQTGYSSLRPKKMHSPKKGAKRAFLSAADLKQHLAPVINALTRTIELPYPHFSAKTVQGKPLHMWTLEDRLDEIAIPTKTSMVYSLKLTDIETKNREQIATEARTKIDTIPTITDPRKALGNNFRRTDVRADWQRIFENTFSENPLPDTYHIAHFHCIASSGTYMRTLAKIIAEQSGTVGLAWHIHRTHIGVFDPENQSWKLAY